MLILLLLFLVVPLAQADRLDGAVQDEAVITNQYWGSRDLALALARNLGAGWVRMNLDIRHPFDLDPAVDAARARGMHVQVTILGQPDPPHAGAFYDVTRAIAQHYQGRVGRYSIWNEPDCCGWLKPNPVCRSAKVDTATARTTATRVRRYRYVRRWKRVHARRQPSRWVRRRVRKRIAYLAYVTGSKTLTASQYQALCGEGAMARVYRSLYDAGYAAIKSVDPSDQVFLGEVSPNDAIPLLREVLSYGPLKTDGLAIHPYQFATPPEQQGSDFVGGGIGYLSAYNQLLDEAYATGTLRTPQGAKPGIYITEFGYFLHGWNDGVPSSWILPPDQRADWLARAWAWACQTPNVKEMTQYQVMDTAGQPVWDTGIVDLATGQPDSAYLSLQAWIQQHPECVDQVARGS
jgi:hypothetical protein